MIRTSAKNSYRSEPLGVRTLMGMEPYKKVTFGPKLLLGRDAFADHVEYFLAHLGAHLGTLYSYPHYVVGPTKIELLLT